MRLVVTGTDTDIGKTVVATSLALQLDAHYWKPVQSGHPTDTDRAKKILGPEKILPCTHTLEDPVSPHHKPGITLDDFDLPTHENLVVEGAGGVLCPLNDSDTFLDLFERFSLPVVVVARSGLGTLNHTMLTLNALRSRGLEVMCVILNGPLHEDNMQFIEKAGKVDVIPLLPLPTINRKTLQEAAPCLMFGAH